uniref:Solute carrier family 13 member 2 n=1 Tax=Schistocephalus solidus TaxID=70667 RepID=A0A0X3PC88_SCHSO
MDQRRIPAWLTILVIYTRYIFIVLYPIILSPVLILYPGTEAKAAYILLLMSGFWITGFIPLYVTALFPLILAPLMGLAPSAVIAKEYSSSSNFLFLGGMILAIAAENVNLHRRIAVAFVRWMGHDARLLILSVMLPTWFFSMWMSNTATTVMMVTVVEALLSKLDEVTGAGSEEEDLNERTGTDSKGRKRLRNFATGISLSVCYAASCGGIATLIGSPPNIIFYGLAVSEYGSGISVNFGSWMAYGCPISIICLICTWITICLLFIGPKAFFKCRRRSKNDEADKFYTDDDARVQSMDNLEERERSTDQEENDEISSDIVKIVKKVSEEEQRALGPMKFGEIACMILLLLLIALWVTREPGVPGWSRFMPTSNDSTGKIVRYVDDTQSTLLFAILAFIIPASNPFRLRADPNETSKQARKRINRGILTWDLAQSRTSWGVLILMGGGFALSKIATVSCLGKCKDGFMGFLRKKQHCICLVSIRLQYTSREEAIKGETNGNPRWFG